MNTRNLRSIFLMFGALGVAQANAFQFDTCWPDPVTWDNDITVKLLPISFPTTHPDRGDIVTSYARWNDMRGMHFEFENIIDDNDNTIGLGSDGNEVAFVSNAAAGGALAVTQIRFDVCFFGQDIEEADMRFNNSVTWEFGDHDPRAVEGNASFRFTAVHEMGHVLGLLHEPNQMAVMMNTASAFHGGSAAFRSAPFGDDARGARTLYSHSNSETDFSITNFRRTGSDATALILGSGTQNTPRGGTFNSGFAFVNQGNTFIDANFVIVLSTNNIISTSDRVIASGRAFGPAGTFVFATFPLRVPGDLAPGTYFVGGILDPANIISEAREANNRVAFPGLVNVTP